MDNRDKIIVFGAGLAGLSAGYALTEAGFKVSVFESGSQVGGLSRTVVHGDFRFDLGGHRFVTKSPRAEKFVKALMGPELLTVPRKSKIYMRGKYFDYPLKPVNAVFGLGLPVTARILADYAIESVRNAGGRMKKQKPVSLEDWVVGNFGRTMFDIYFKEYSEKVWGLDCSRISAEWVERRINGLSLGKAIKSAIIRANGRKAPPTLADRFLYPALGIGRISERLRQEIEKDGKNLVATSSRLRMLEHRNWRIERAVLQDSAGKFAAASGRYVSTIPLVSLVRSLSPAPPEDVLRAAGELKFRGLIVVALMIGRPRVTEQTWIYIPEKKIPVGRIHEPVNWSPALAPEGRTSLVAEIFCDEADETWRKGDQELSEIAASSLEQLGFIRRKDMLDYRVVRVPAAYPLFEVGFEKKVDTLMRYLGKFKNLHTIGRSGLFKYYNMDHAIESGLDITGTILSSSESPSYASSASSASSATKASESLEKAVK